MLKKIHISNYVLIQHLEVDFSPGFTVITGETGAGKSIILGALGLILGQRVDLSSKLNSEKKILAEGTFDISGYDLSYFFDQHELDYDPAETTLRREIAVSGKSRAFINDTPVNLAILKQLGVKLVDIHSQHENQQLLNIDYQLQFLDDFGAWKDLKEEVNKAYHLWNETKKRHSELLKLQQKAKQEEDFLNFQFDELDAQDISESIIENISSELKLLQHAEEIGENIGQGLIHVSEHEFSAISQVKQAFQAISKLVDFNPLLKDISDRLNSCAIELDDIRLEMEQLNSGLEMDPVRLQFLNEQMDEINSLMHKHGVSTGGELRGIKESIQQKLLAISGYSEEIEELENQLKNQEQTLQELSEKLSEKRLKKAPELAKLIEKDLKMLGMPNAKLGFSFQKLAHYSKNGVDAVKLQFTANKGQSVNDLEKVASGGERSRLMLVLKKIHASYAQTPTLILDEIDTGISGEVAAKTASMLSEMTKNSQMISITHLPQVAAKAQNHLLVKKGVSAGKTSTSLQVLNEEERRREIARMLSGEKITQAALDHAMELMK